MTAPEEPALRELAQDSMENVLLQDCATVAEVFLALLALGLIITSCIS
jgi:hypothetical protein